MRFMKLPDKRSNLRFTNSLTLILSFLLLPFLQVGIEDLVHVFDTEEHQVIEYSAVQDRKTFGEVVY